MRLIHPLRFWAVALCLLVLGFSCSSEVVEVPEPDESAIVNEAEVAASEENLEIEAAESIDEPNAEAVEIIEESTEAVVESADGNEMAEEVESESVADTEVAEPAEVATIEVRFIESAPKDKFLFSNTGSCELAEAIATIDLTNTAGKLIFDTMGEGAGVEVFQPFEISEGEIELISSDRVIDGDTGLTVRISSFSPGVQVGFTIDVDDTLTDSDLGMIRVTDSEMSGGEVLLEANGQSAVSAAFGENNLITLTATCA